MHLNQFVKTTKPLIDAIGNLESRQATLADCMLELIRCARTMTRLVLVPDEEDVGFWMKAKSVFNRRFHEMDTSVHSLALFLHPLGRRLAISQVANGRTYEQMVKTALEIAKRWRFSKEAAAALAVDLKLYYQGKAPFSGGQSDALEWWDSLPVSGAIHPLKTFAIILFSIVPHAADIERLFSDLGGVQSAKRCRLAVPTFEKLGKLRSNYSYHLTQRAAQDGKPRRRKHAHMHTRPEGGLNVELAEDLERDFAWIPPMTVAHGDSETDGVDGPESMTVEELEKAFDEFERELQESREAAEASGEVVDGGEVLEGAVYDFDELERVDAGTVPATFEEVARLPDEPEAVNDEDWDVEALMASAGVA